MTTEVTETGLTASGPSGVIKITQLPAIEQNLRDVKAWVGSTVAGYLAQAHDAESLQEVKAVRTMLNKMFSEFDNRRKEIKREILAPVDQFEGTFKECITEEFQKAISQLTEKINAEESRMKTACDVLLRGFFCELATAKGVSFLTYEQAGITVSMADAKAKTQPPKKLREQIEQFIDRVAQDVALIDRLEDSSEIMAVYMQCLSTTTAITAVKARHERERLARDEKEHRDAARAEEAEVIRKVEAFTAPVVTPDTETPTESDKLTIAFTVTDTRERLIMLRQFLQANNYNYK